MARLVRIATATLIVLSLAFVMSAAGLYFLLRGEAIENSLLTSQIKSRVERLIGPQFAIDLGTTTIGFDPDGLLSLTGTNVAVRRSTDRQVVSQLGKIVIGVKPLSALRGDPQIDAVIVEDSSIDASLLPVPPAAAGAADLSAMIEGLRAHLERSRDQFAQSRFRLFEFRGIEITGLGLGRLEKTPVTLDSLEIRFRRKSLTADASLRTPMSTIAIAAAYERSQDGGRGLVIDVGGLSLREWTRAPAVAEGQIGSDAVFSISAHFPFGPDGSTLDPTVNVASGPSTLRIGREATTDIRELAVNLRLLPTANHIEIEPSPVSGGDFAASFSGGIAPAEGGDWIGGPWKFVVRTDDATRAPTVEGEDSMPLSASAVGSFEPEGRRLDISEFRFRSAADSLGGSASFVFQGPTPAVTASLSGTGMPVAALKQAWPFFVAPPVRNWVHRNISGGRIGAVSLEANLPPGVIGRFRQGARMQPEEYKLTADFSQVRIRTFGAVPELADAKGTFRMQGMAVTADLDGGTAQAAGAAAVAVEAGSYRVADFGVRPNIAEINLSASGAASDLAAIAESKPLSVLSRLQLTPGGVSGKADVDIAARFPVQPGLVYADVQWNVIAELYGAASSEKIFGRSVRKADVRIEADPSMARVTGEAEVDGTATDLALVEPIGESGIARERRVTARLDEAARKKMGFNLDPVVSGVIDVELEQQKDGPEKQTVVLDDATISLPWVGWSKGKGIPAKATFVMRKDKGVTRLDDFYIEGPGFSAAGRMVIDKAGLLSADFANISLNQDDSFSLKLDRKAKSYDIAISGLRYDARGLIAKLFHERGYGDGDGAGINLTASLEEVKGFHGRVLRGVEMTYGARNGALDSLSLRGAFDDAAYVSVFAVTKDGRTTFNIDSTDAGGTLAFVDIYNRMRGGKLSALLSRTGSGPFTGEVSAHSFVVEDEPKLARLVSEPIAAPERGASIEPAELQRLDVKRVRFQEASARIEKGDGYFNIRDGVFTSAQIGFTFDGVVYDQNNRMDLAGTFLPAIGISRAIGIIPFVGEILGNGRDSGLIGVTFRLRGPTRNPQIDINPVSIVAPGMFRKVFEYKN